MGDESLPSQLIEGAAGLFDMAYGHEPTQAVTAARDAGLPTVAGNRHVDSSGGTGLPPLDGASRRRFGHEKGAQRQNPLNKVPRKGDNLRSDAIIGRREKPWFFLLQCRLWSASCGVVSQPP